MNIIFEGISGSGKTTIINELCANLNAKNISFEMIGDLEYETPIKKILLNMVSANPLMDGNETFKTSLYESLLLAANHHYVQEKLRCYDKMCIYDRDFISLLAYQKIILAKDYDNYEEIFDIYKKLVLINLKKIDYIFYVDIPMEVCIERTEKRDKRLFKEEDIIMLKKIKEEYLLQLNDYRDKVVYLDGTDSPKENMVKVLKYINRK